jgi:hypothetical protein
MTPLSIEPGEEKADPSWAWVLGAALGGKAFQSFAEISGKGK